MYFEIHVQSTCMYLYMYRIYMYICVKCGPSGYMNTTPQSLSLSLHWAVFTLFFPLFTLTGGDDISLQCQKRVREKGPLSNGEVFCCMASGQLKCRAVVHAVGPVWEGGKNQEDVLLREVIYSSLETCDSPQNQFR